LLTYGDGVGDIDISKLIRFHREHGKLASITTTRPPARFGAVKFNAGQTVTSFEEKPEGDGSWINGGFFVLNPRVIDLIKGDDTSWEKQPLNNLAERGELKAFKHEGFWKPMDSLRDKISLNELWKNGEAPWKVWK